MEPNLPPRPAWHWLVLLTPAVVMLTLCWIFERTIDGEPQIGALFWNLLTIPVFSVGLGLWWMWRQPTVRDRISMAIVASVVIAFFNGLIAFAGCSLGIMR